MSEFATGTADEKLLRIGELSRRVGVPVESLRAWERRYGLLTPSRTQGGFRLYGEDDVARVLAMRANLDRGLFAAEAARLALSEDVTEPSRSPAPVADASELAAALDRFDEAGAQQALDRLLATLTIDVVLRDVLLPYLHKLGERWESGETSIAQEHFASNVLRGRLTALARGWDRGSGPRVLLACVEGERHDIALVGSVSRCAVTVGGSATSVRTRQWRLSSSAHASCRPTPSSSPAPSRARSTRAPCSCGRSRCTLHLHLAGAAANGRVARRAHGTLLAGDVVAAAEVLAAGRR